METWRCYRVDDDAPKRIEFPKKKKAKTPKKIRRVEVIEVIEVEPVYLDKEYDIIIINK